jgi:hypothetical protein
MLYDVEDPTSNPGAPPKILKFFSHEHLPQGSLRVTSKLFQTLALEILKFVPDNAEREMALRKLLEAKDAAVRACLP